MAVAGWRGANTADLLSAEWFNLSASGVEEALYNSRAIRGLSGSISAASRCPRDHGVPVPPSARSWSRRVERRVNQKVAPSVSRFVQAVRSNVPMGRTPDHSKTSSPRPNGLMARPGTESSNPSPSSGESRCTTASRRRPTTDEDPNKYGDQVPGGKNTSASLFVDHITNIDD